MPAVLLLPQEHNVSNVELVKQLIEEANHRRSVGSTAANSDSSRSHSIMQFALKRFIAGGAASRLVGWMLDEVQAVDGSCALAPYRDRSYAASTGACRLQEHVLCRRCSCWQQHSVVCCCPWATVLAAAQPQSFSNLETPLRRQ